MNSYNSNSNSAAGIGGGGVSFAGLVQIAFLVLKLCHIIDWPWFWVLFPCILSLGILALLGLGLLILFIVWAIQEKKQEKKYEKKRVELQQVKEDKEEKERLERKAKEAEKIIDTSKGITIAVSQAREAFLDSLRLDTVRYHFYSVSTRDRDLRGEIPDHEISAINAWLGVISRNYAKRNRVVTIRRQKSLGLHDEYFLEDMKKQGEGIITERTEISTVLLPYNENEGYLEGEGAIIVYDELLESVYIVNFANVAIH